MRSRVCKRNMDIPTTIIHIIGQGNKGMQQNEWKYRLNTYKSWLVKNAASPSSYLFYIDAKRDQCKYLFFDLLKCGHVIQRQQLPRISEWLLPWWGERTNGGEILECVLRSTLYKSTSHSKNFLKHLMAQSIRYSQCISEE